MTVAIKAGNFVLKLDEQKLKLALISSAMCAEGVTVEEENHDDGGDAEMETKGEDLRVGAD